MTMQTDMPKSAYLVNLSGTAELKLVEAVAAAMPSGQVRPSTTALVAHYSFVYAIHLPHIYTYTH